MYCHQCGKPLTIGIEKYCPYCGAILLQQKEGQPLDERDTHSIGITDTKGDVFGTGVSGTGHIIGKEIGYIVQGNVIHLNIGSNISREIIDNLQKMITAPTQIDQAVLTKEITSTAKEEDTKNKIEETNSAQQQIKSVLEQVDKIEKKEGTKIEEIRTETIQISRTELLLKKYLLKGNEHSYKKKYFEAIRCYDKALEINPNNVYAWSNKGTALDKLGMYEEAIRCYDKALEINPNNVYAWSNKGTAFSNLGKYQKAVEHYDKATELDPNDAYAWNNKGNALANLGKYEEAIRCYDKALEINPNMSVAQQNRNLSYKLL
jgi:tetratricopeptide (TPR) repeat protein